MEKAEFVVGRTDLTRKFNTVVQNYRMISGGKKTGWPLQEIVYSTAAIGMDADNNVLLIFCRAPYSTHDFIDLLLALPVNIYNVMCVEGGPEATLYVKANGKEVEWVGSCETKDT